MFSSLRNRNFLLFWSGALAANTGGWFQSLTVPVLLYQLTESPLWVGYATLCQFLPVMLLGPLGGRLADSPRVKTVLMACQSVRALAALTMLLVWFSPLRSPEALIILALVTGAAQGLGMPGLQTLMPSLVDRRHLQSAVTLNTAQFNLARSLGPAAGGVGLLFGGPLLALGAAFILILFVVVALALVRVDSIPVATTSAGAQTPRATFGAALRQCASDPQLRTALILVLLIGVVGMPIFQHMITFSESIFQTGIAGITAFNLSLGVGTLLGLAVMNKALSRGDGPTLHGLFLIVYGLGILAFGASPGPIPATVALLVVGLAFLISLSMCNNTIQLVAPHGLRGRVLAINVMVYTGANSLGAWLQGLTSEVFGLRPTVLTAGAVLLTGGFAYFMWKYLRTAMKRP